MVLVVSCLLVGGRFTPERTSADGISNVIAGKSNSKIIYPGDDVQAIYDAFKTDATSLNVKELQFYGGTYTATETLAFDANYVNITGIGAAGSVVITSEIGCVYDNDAGDSFDLAYASGGTAVITATHAVFQNIVFENTYSSVVAWTGPTAVIINNDQTGTADYASATNIISNSTVEISGNDGDEVYLDGRWYGIYQTSTSTSLIPKTDGTEPSNGTGKTIRVAKRGVRFENCKFIAPAPITVASGTSIGCGVDGSVYINCYSNVRGFRTVNTAVDADDGDMHALMYNCVMGPYSVGGDVSGGQVSGRYYSCDSTGKSFGGCDSFGMNVHEDAYFFDCIGGEGSFGIGRICNGTFISCVGGAKSFGGYNSGTNYGTFSGLAIGCIAGDNSFGSGHASSKNNGTMKGCRVTGLSKPIYCEGAKIEDSFIQVTGTNEDCLILLDGNTVVYNSTLIANGTGDVIDTNVETTARNVVAGHCRGNTTIDDDITNLLTGAATITGDAMGILDSDIE
jgi:hypothetical protein